MATICSEVILDDKPYADQVSTQCSGDCLHVHDEGLISDAAACYTYCLDINNIQPCQSVQEQVSETLDTNSILTWLIIQGDFIPC